MTPEQRHRQSEETNGSPRYSDGRPKYHRHFAEYTVHADEDCRRPSRWIRVYVFDAEDLERHEEFLANRARG